MTRVLIVEDDALMRAGLRGILEREPALEVVGEAQDGREALAHARRTRPDVVLMDIRMPRMDGLTAARCLSEQGDPPKVIVLTTFDADEHVLRALGDGASGFLLKDTSPAKIVEAIEKGCRRRGDAVAERDGPVDPQGRSVAPHGRDGGAIPCGGAAGEPQ
jgi:DNA-binding NarL/FixJ family response regulator